MKDNTNPNNTKGSAQLEQQQGNKNSQPMYRNNGNSNQHGSELEHSRKSRQQSQQDGIDVSSSEVPLESPKINQPRKNEPTVDKNY